MIRVRTPFYRDNCGRHLGSGVLLTAMGFEHALGGVGMDEACFQLPLARSNEPYLTKVAAELDENIRRVEGLQV